MKSVEIFISPRLHEVYQRLVLNWLDQDLRKKLRKRELPSLDFYLILEEKDRVCDYVVNNLRNTDASKLTSIINELDDYAAKIRDPKDPKILGGPIKFRDKEEKMIHNISANIRPVVPQGTIFIGNNLKRKLKERMSITLYSREYMAPRGFNEGSERLIRDFIRKYGASSKTMPPLWALAHLYIESDIAKDFFNNKLVLSSSISNVPEKGGSVYIGHSARASKTLDQYTTDKHGVIKVSQEGILIQLEAEQYPGEDISLYDFINKYTQAARAVFLMDDRQLERLLQISPQCGFDQERPAMQGSGYLDARRRFNPLSFGTRKVDDMMFFGVTCIQYLPLTSFPISFETQNEFEEFLS